MDLIVAKLRSSQTRLSFVRQEGLLSLYQQAPQGYTPSTDADLLERSTANVRRDLPGRRYRATDQARLALWDLLVLTESVKVTPLVSEIMTYRDQSMDPWL